MKLINILSIFVIIFSACSFLLINGISLLRMRLRFITRGLCCSIALGLPVSVLASATGQKYGYVDMDDFQIDWVIPNGEFLKNGSIIPHRTELNVTVIPRKLFISDKDILDYGRNVKLAPKNTQFYLMIGQKFMVCSLDRTQIGFLSSESRICFLDTNNDKKFDLYFFITPNDNFLTSDFLWFALNGYIPENVYTIDPMILQEIDRKMAQKVPEYKINFFVLRENYVSVRNQFEGRLVYFNKCKSKTANYEKLEFIVENCILDGNKITIKNGSSKIKTDRQIVLSPPNRDLEVRFNYSKAIIGRGIKSIIIR